MVKQHCVNHSNICSVVKLLRSLLFFSWPKLLSLLLNEAKRRNYDSRKKITFDKLIHDATWPIIVLVPRMVKSLYYILMLDVLHQIDFSHRKKLIIGIEYFHSALLRNGSYRLISARKERFDLRDPKYHSCRKRLLKQHLGLQTLVNQKFCNPQSDWALPLAILISIYGCVPSQHW